MEIKDHQYEQFYRSQDDRKLFSIDIDLEAEIIDSGGREAAMKAVDRIRLAAKKEAQAVRDEMDSEGYVGDPE